MAHKCNCRAKWFVLGAIAYQSIHLLIVFATGRALDEWVALALL